MIGQQIGPYKILEEIGRGGMARVFRAYDPRIDRPVALKIINSNFLFDNTALERFSREARLIARLEHPHILPIYNFDSKHDPPYIAMRYIPSGTLREAISARRLEMGAILHLFRQTCPALDYAHSQGVVHRDIKPSNIMIDLDGNALITDFGIARIVESDTHITASGASIGTPHYMAPEQGMGEKIDGRADLYSMGVILFEILAGQYPYTAETGTGIIMKHILDPVPDVRQFNAEVSMELAEVVYKSMAKKAVDRYQTGVEFVRALENVMPVTGDSPEQLFRTLATMHLANQNNQPEQPSQQDDRDAGKQDQFGGPTVSLSDGGMGGPTLEGGPMQSPPYAESPPWGIGGPTVPEQQMHPPADSTSPPGTPPPHSPGAPFPQQGYQQQNYPPQTPYGQQQPYGTPPPSPYQQGTPLPQGYQQQGYPPPQPGYGGGYPPQYGQPGPWQQQPAYPIPEDQQKRRGTWLWVLLPVLLLLVGAGVAVFLLSGGEDESGGDRDNVVADNETETPEPLPVTVVPTDEPTQPGEVTIQPVDETETPSEPAILPSPTFTEAFEPSATPTDLLMPTSTASLTATPTVEALVPPTSGVTSLPSFTSTATPSETATASNTPTLTPTYTPTPTETQTPTLTLTPTIAITPTPVALALSPITTDSARNISELYALDSGAVVSMALSDNGRWLATGGCQIPDGNTCLEGMVQVWDMRTGLQAGRTLMLESGVVSNVAFHPSETVVAVGDVSGTITLWNWLEDAVIDTWSDHDAAIIAMDFAPDGAQLVSSAEDNTVLLWNVSQGRQVTLFQDTRFRRVIFSPTGNQVAVTAGTEIIMVNVQNRQEFALAHDDLTTAVAFSPDGSLIAAGNIQGGVRIWRTNSRSEQQLLLSGNEPVTGLSFSEDNRLLATSAADGTTRLWNIQTGEIVNRLFHQDDLVLDALFALDSTLLASGSGDGIIRVWGIENR